MARYKITAPEAAYVGSISGVPFRDGVAEVDDSVPTVAAVLDYCRNAGYHVEPVEEPKAAEAEPEQVAAETPKRGRTKAAAKQEKSDEGAAAPKQEETQ